MIEANAVQEGLDEDGDAAILAIQNEYACRLSSVRRLPKHEKAAAYRALKEWYQRALVELRERRMRDRQAQLLQQRLRRRRLLRPAGETQLT